MSAVATVSLNHAFSCWDSGASEAGPKRKRPPKKTWSGSPSSRIVGGLPRSGKRSSVNVASATSRPARSCGNSAGVGATTKWIGPADRDRSRWGSNRCAGITGKGVAAVRVEQAHARREFPAGARPGEHHRVAGGSMAAMLWSSPEPQFGHCCLSISNTRLSSRAQLIRCGGAWTGSASHPAATAASVAAWRGAGCDSGRSVA